LINETIDSNDVMMVEVRSLNSFNKISPSFLHSSSNSGLPGLHGSNNGLHIPSVEKAICYHVSKLNSYSVKASID